VKVSRRIQCFGILWTCATLLLSGCPFVSIADAQDANNSTQAPSDQPNPKSNKSGEQATVRLRIQVNGDNDKPISNASVYVRYNVPGGLIHKEKLAELDMKTSGDGSARVPAVPQGKILIQVIAAGWHTYGKWYDIVGKDEDSIEIKLDPPHHWY
jgi:type 1 fimbria pilin